MAKITGTEDDDTLSGTDENDNIWGLGGNDTLDGGAGSSQAEVTPISSRAATGADIFTWYRYISIGGIDHITDFNTQSGDVIEFSSRDIYNYDTLLSVSHDTAGGVYVSLGSETEGVLLMALRLRSSRLTILSSSRALLTKETQAQLLRLSASKV